MPTFATHPLEAVICHEGRPVARCVLRRGRYFIGQDRKNEIVVDAPSVSARHAQLTVGDDGELSIRDLDSANGTHLNGQPVDGPTPITLDCLVEFGSTTLVFQRGGLPAAIFPYLPAGFFSAQSYAVGDAIVQGSTSTIHEARELWLNRDVAMKLMLPESQAKPGHVLRFIREAQIAAQLQHPGILPIYALGLDDERRLYATTRFVEGDSLPDLLAQAGSDSAPTLAALVGILQKVCDTLAYAHSRGVVHCTLRPEIITVGRFGEVFVNNWGFAKLLPLADEDAPSVQAPAAGAEPALSPYSAPEQAEDALADIGPHTDIHALGGILYRILTLRDPIRGETESELLEQALSPRETPADLLAGQPPCPHWPGGKLPEPLAALAMQALSLARDDRPASVRKFQQNLAAWQDSTTSGSAESGKLWKGFAGLLGRH